MPSKNFNYRHCINLIKWQKIKYAAKVFVQLLKNDDFIPSFRPRLTYGIDTEEFQKFLEEGLPMGGYEYHCCLQYLSIIQNCFKNAKKNNLLPPLYLEFPENTKIISPPLEDCLELLLNDLGFSITEEHYTNCSYIYQIDKQ